MGLEVAEANVELLVSGNNVYLDFALMFETCTIWALRWAAMSGSLRLDVMWEVLWNLFSDVDTVETAARIHKAENLIVVALDSLDLLCFFGG